MHFVAFVALESCGPLSRGFGCNMTGSFTSFLQLLLWLQQCTMIQHSTSMKSPFLHPPSIPLQPSDPRIDVSHNSLPLLFHQTSLLRFFLGPLRSHPVRHPRSLGSLTSRTSDLSLPSAWRFGWSSSKLCVFHAPFSSTRDTATFDRLSLTPGAMTCIPTLDR